ncbi:MAG: adenylosuccinate synthase [Porphyromonadaceae bacterium]|nr:MAG: adenylosuccinate synthase [Porphyromonadaceae bacterium]
MKVDVLLGLQWGDEGKGKLVDALTRDYDVIARFQGGPNAGHTLEFNNQKHVLHTIPSGIFHPDKLNLIGNGLVIDPVVFKKEVDRLTGFGMDIRKNLFISKKSHLILPTHRLLDAASEASKGAGKIGSTLKGIGPAYTDKTGREGLRVGDILEKSFLAKYHCLRDLHLRKISQFNYPFDLQPLEDEWLASIEFLRSFQFVNGEYLINEWLKAGHRILAEGAQGSMLDIDFGSYPFVTSSNTTCAGACTGLGVAPGRIGNVIGIIKAYSTRVGSGPFPTELLDETGERLRTSGHEYGSTTGRPRRCGWLDMVALRYTVMLDGVTSLIMTKADVLSGFDTLRVATAYKINGKTTREIPFDTEAPVEPVYTDLPGWKEDISGICEKESLPENLKGYIRFVENHLGIPVTIVSVGPDRNATIQMA